ncbi:hypothetical protein [Phaeobacter sp. B1627]|uniref:hypothetical protein n=1 Tax=Phaeobacter sp. B1627 TaxID=2583809 RepID=UPI00159ED19B|nr:hypothetical protein [Phaeobacter sp. B1627]
MRPKNATAAGFIVSLLIPESDLSGILGEIVAEIQPERQKLDGFATFAPYSALQKAAKSAPLAIFSFLLNTLQNSLIFF